MANSGSSKKSTSRTSPRSPRPRLTAAERSDQALAAARRLVLTGGIEAASVRNVAAEAGMATGSLRHIFPSHESLFIALMSDNAARAATRIRAVFERELAAGTPVRGTFLAVLREVIPLDDVSRTDFIVQLALMTGHPDSAPIREAIAEAGAQLDQLCAGAVAQLRPDLFPGDQANNESANAPGSNAGNEGASWAGSEADHAAHSAVDGEAAHAVHSALAAELATDLRVAIDGIAMRCLENLDFASGAGTNGAADPGGAGSDSGAGISCAEATLARALDRIIDAPRP